MSDYKTTPLEWKQTLMMIYRKSRKLPRWDLVYDCHDEEDKKFFDELDKREEKK